MLAILLLGSLVIIIAIVIFYILNPRPIVGDALVNQANGSPMEVPSPSISPLYAKPITYLFASSVIFGYCFFALSRSTIANRVPRVLRHGLLILSIMFLAVGMYEVLFNFSLWSAVMVTHSDPDTAYNQWPINSLKINLSYATKISVLWVIISFFAVMTFKSSLESDAPSA